MKAILIPKRVANNAIQLSKIVGLITAVISPIIVRVNDIIIKVFLPKKSPIKAETINPRTLPRNIMKIRKLSSFASLLHR